MNRMRILLVTAVMALSLSLSLASATVFAQAYPVKPIRMIVTYPAGAASDILSRLLGQKVSEELGQQVVVDNRPGGNTLIGVELAAKAAGDGYTLLMGQAQNLAIVPGLYSKLPYDTITDFVPVAFVGYGPLLLVTSPTLPANSVRELIALAKTKPGELKFPSSGSGGSTHLAGELFKTLAGIDMQHIPYQGGSAPILAIISGQVDLGFDSIVQVLPHVKAGKLKALAVTTTRRSLAAPDIPTMAEAGLPEYEVAPWFGVVAPKGTPPEVIARLHAAFTKAMQLPDVKERFATLGLEPQPMSSDEFGRHIRSERAKWAKVVKDANAKVD